MKNLKLNFRMFLVLWLALPAFSAAFLPAENPEKQAQELFARFAAEYPQQNIPEFGFDYKANFRNIASPKEIAGQTAFFEKHRKNLLKINPEKLTAHARLNYDHLLYELNLNLERLQLEKQFRQQKNQNIPETGLAALPNGKAWYRFYARYYTSTNLSADELMQFGQAEVRRVQKEIRRLRAKMGFEHDSAGFYAHLQSSAYLLHSEKEVENQYRELQRTALQHLEKLFAPENVSSVLIKPWPEAGPNTPPGYYQPSENEQTTAAVFHYNFYGRKHNRRVMPWMFLHEGIPGHHYQTFLRNNQAGAPPFSAHFYYPANTEGWAAYVENYGAELGLYQTNAQELGKWEWDLVRSARVVLDVGMHADGWTKEQALAYWQKNVPGQEEIAEREVSRCLNWAGQVLSYKIGEKVLKEMLAKTKQEQGDKFDLKAFHAAYLAQGMRPMEVIKYALQTNS